jgi:hypothetical protein
MTYARPMNDERAAFEDAVLARAPPGSVVVGSAISPDGRWGVALTILPSASGYPMDDLFERINGRWIDAGGGSAGGVGWTSLDRTGDTGVLRFADEAPAGTKVALIDYEGRKYRVPVSEGWFFLAVWETANTEEPRLSWDSSSRSGDIPERWPKRPLGCFGDGRAERMARRPRPVARRVARLIRPLSRGAGPRRHVPELRHQ